MLMVILVLFSLSAACLLSAGVTTILHFVNANTSNLRRIELRDRWDARAIRMPDGSELVYSPFASRLDEIQELDACITEFRASAERACNYAKLAKDWLLCAVCIAGIALIYIYLLMKGSY